MYRGQAYIIVRVMPRFIDEKIDVAVDGEIKQPREFIWRGRTYTVASVLHSWQDWGFAKGAVQRNWRSRRHRNYFQVRTEDGEIFELYLDRGAKPGRDVWYLYQQLDADREPL